ncbi:LacI family DNA-binding transcriptional regulator [Paenarthrobacter nicotinovorans]|uniref:LacI family DNA-binding transcriptional regulator n=1 Tax=Paenarthrobacter nicotinovorans TaxID=29320 RepID=A0ABV0GQA9_PAENI|nr:MULTISPECIES: LacI family DNA-binding transcriptional regulator [Micrococcaceae]BCW56904.1 LacI family transcriptional regulator [Arthrobacter sp. StoSoilB20]
MAVTMNDVARVAGVSLKTVSNVINNYEFIRPATKQRVLDAIDELGYEANLTARSLRSGKTSMIGLVLADLSIPYYAELASDIMKAAWARGYRVLVEQSGNGPGHEKAALQGQFRTLTDGLLFIPLALDAEQIMEAAGKKPLVLLGEYVQDPRLNMVLIQNHRAAAAVTAHLLAGGRRRIAVLGAHDGDTTGSNGLRLEGYKAALADAGVAYDPALVIDCDWRRDGGAEGTARLLDSGVEFDAVFGLNDALALGALHELLVRGRKVPEEIAVAGFDDIDEAKFASPSLTTVAPGRAEIAERAVELLINRIENKDAPLHVQQPQAAFELRIRQSAP